MRIGRAAGVTDTGLQRLRNEDAFVCEPPLFAVADGMGGARAGEVAARLAAAALEEAREHARDADDVAELIAEANRRIFERSRADPQTSGMGTTVTLALVGPENGTVTIGHVGDSRAYLLRDGAIEQLTTDHSLVAELVEGGVLTPEEAEHHPQRSAITRALGTDPTVEVDTLTVEVLPGDLILLCSDGLSTMLTDERVASLVEEAGRDPAHAADALVAAANAQGGVDNVTVVLFEIVEGSPEQETSHAAADEGSESERDPTSRTPTPDPGEGRKPVGAAVAPEVSTHGAGPGGRLGALLLIAVVVVLAALVLYWGIAR